MSASPPVGVFGLLAAFGAFGAVDVFGAFGA